MSPIRCAWCGDEPAPNVRPSAIGNDQHLCDVCADEFDEAEADDNAEAD